MFSRNIFLNEENFMRNKLPCTVKLLVPFILSINTSFADNRHQDYVADEHAEELSWDEDQDSSCEKSQCKFKKAKKMAKYFPNKKDVFRGYKQLKDSYHWAIETGDVTTMKNIFLRSRKKQYSARNKYLGFGGGAVAAAALIPGGPILFGGAFIGLATASTYNVRKSMKYKKLKLRSKDYLIDNLGMDGFESIKYGNDYPTH